MNNENTMSIASSAMLVEMSISTWTARKLDKKVSTQVDFDKNMKTRAGNYNKNLLAGTGFLDTITKYAATARAWHLSQTLPWSDNGLRLLPMSNFLTSAGGRAAPSSESTSTRTSLTRFSFCWFAPKNSLHGVPWLDSVFIF